VASLDDEGRDAVLSGLTPSAVVVIMREWERSFGRHDGPSRQDTVA
jgi:hypothetical protein